jgi:adenylate cyclase
MQLRSAADDAFHTGNFASTEWVTLASVEKLLPAAARETSLRPRPRSTGWPPPLPQASGTHTALEVLRLRALVARARGDKPTYRELVERYRAMAAPFGLKGSMAWAEGMP